jgi:amino-acid N-acetyltransferase
MTQPPVIASLTDADWPAVLGLLEAAKLPPDGLGRHRDTTLVALENGRVVGCVALEVYGDGALLRSLAVDPGWRGRGLGVRLTEAALSLARDLGRPAVYLLTETADRFFPRFGFRPVDRDDFPAGVKTSVEFTTACPSSARAFALSFPSPASREMGQG